MLTALIAGERDPKTIAQLAHGVMRRKIPQLQQALSGRFEAHHAFLAAAMLRRIDALAADIAEIDTGIDQLIAPFAAVVDQLDEITGVGVRSAQEIVAEVGLAMTAFPTAGHLVSWAKFAPIDNQSAGRKKTASTGKGNPWLAATLGESVAALARTNTFLGDRYRRLARRRGKKRAIVAVGNSLLTIIWHLLSDPDARYHDLGPDYYQSEINKQRRERELIRQLEHLTATGSPSSPPPDRRAPNPPRAAGPGGRVGAAAHSWIFESAAGRALPALLRAWIVLVPTVLGSAESPARRWRVGSPQVAAACRNGR